MITLGRRCTHDVELVRSRGYPLLKAGIVGRLVANDFSGAIISAELLEFDPDTGERLDYVEVSRLLEKNIRKKFESNSIDVVIDVHIIGFAKIVGDITSGAGIFAKLRS